MKLHKFFITLLFLFFPLILFAKVKRLIGIYPLINGTTSISDRFDFTLQTTSTFVLAGIDDDGTSLPGYYRQFELQPSLIYKATPVLNLALGYLHQRNEPLEESPGVENRMWQQIVWAVRSGGTRWTHRLRFEERFVQSPGETKAKFSTRVRYQTAVRVPLMGKTIDLNEFYFSAFNEMYFLTSGGQNAFYNTNWSFAGVGYSLPKLGRIEFGPLLQIIRRRNETTYFGIALMSWNFSL